MILLKLEVKFLMSSLYFSSYSLSSSFISFIFASFSYSSFFFVFVSFSILFSTSISLFSLPLPHFSILFRFSALLYLSYFLLSSLPLSSSFLSLLPFSFTLRLFPLPLFYSFPSPDHPPLFLSSRPSSPSSLFNFICSLTCSCSETVSF